jgi:hypothetical protein
MRFRGWKLSSILVVLSLVVAAAILAAASSDRHPARTDSETRKSMQIALKVGNGDTADPSPEPLETATSHRRAAADCGYPERARTGIGTLRPEDSCRLSFRLP